MSARKGHLQASRSATSRLTPDQERELLAQVADGDRQAFELLYRTYYPRLVGFVRRVQRRLDLLDEIVNDVLLAVWRAAPSYEGRATVSSWIFGIAYRQSMKALRRNRWWLREEGLPAEDELPIDAAVDDRSPETEVMSDERARRLRWAVSQLPPRQRAAVELAYYEQFSCAEIAQIASCPVNTVKTRLFHARKRLRDLLQGEV